YNGPSIIIAYAHCIAHGINMAESLSHDEMAVRSGAWVLYRFNPDRLKEGKNPLQLDSKKPDIPYSEYAYTETRFRSLLGKDPDRARMLIEAGQKDADHRWFMYSHLADMDYSSMAD
ncbi:MAG: hypothetical protein D6800_14820, partial [Candidatus Zixiibacteriota bacterium]